MGANIEIKARVKNFDKLRESVEKISDSPGIPIPQEDTFFNVAQGRLKLRILAPDEGQLIFYKRLDRSGPKRSDYLIATTSNPQALKDVLAACYGIRGMVRKQRLLYLIGNTRIHLDQVEGLGTFIELEVVLTPNQNDKEGQAIANEWMTKLGIHEKSLVQEAYIDLLENQAA
jgi:predicted adenylyl cyclase CyaB